MIMIKNIKKNQNSVSALSTHVCSEFLEVFCIQSIVIVLQKIEEI